MRLWKLVSALLSVSILALGCATTPVATPAPAPPPAVAAQAQSAPATEAPVIIVGGGLSGLSLAYELQKEGIRTLVVDAAPRLGGRIQTVVFPDGATAEGHMEEYFERSPAVPLLRELGLPLIEDVAHSTVRIDGTIYPYQGEGDRDTYLAGIFDEAERAAFLSWNAKAWAIYEQLHPIHQAGAPLPPELEALTKISLADWVAQEGVPHKVAEWIRVTVEPEMAIEWDQISALDGVDELRLFLDTPDGFGEMNYHVEGGNSEFVRALVSHLDPASLRTQARVTAIEQTATGVTVRVLEHDRTYVELRGKLAVVTAPVHHVGRIQFLPALDADTWKAIQTTRMASYIKVHFRLAPEAARLWEVDGENVLTLLSDSLAGSIYDVSDLQSHEDGTQEIVLTLLLHARFARELMNEPVDVIRERSAEALDALFPGTRALIRSAEIFVYPQAVAYWPLEQGRSRFDELENALRRPHGRLYFGGDTTEDSHSEGAVVSALRIKRQILERRAELE